MNLAYNLILNAYSAMILIVIFVSAIKLTDRRSFQDKYFMLMVTIAILMLGIDVLGRLDGRPHTIFAVLNHVGNFLIFLLNPVLPSLWVTYVHMQIFQDERKTKRLIYPLLFLNLLNVILLILSQFSGWYYHIDSNNIYHRGSLFLLPASITVALMLAAYIITIKNRHWLERRTFLSLLFFAVPPVVCIALQIAFYGVSLILNGVSISLLIVFLNIQNHSIHTDHLTGVNNRKKLDAHLKKKINTSMAHRQFAAIMLDLDNFKTINDVHGHDMGDKALLDVVQILKRSIRANDFIARYGGDEFVILLDISNTADLEAMIQRISKNAEAFNATDCRPYAIEFSMGYTLYDSNAYLGAEDFIKRLDSLMYENKQNKRTTEACFARPDNPS